MKQVGPTSGIVPLSVVAPTAGEGGQLVVEVGHVVATAEVTLNAPSFILAKRERDNDVGVLGRKKSKAPLSLRALRHVVGLTHPQLIEICAPTVTAPVIPSIAFAFSPLVASISAPLFGKFLNLWVLPTKALFLNFSFALPIVYLVY